MYMVAGCVEDVRQVMWDGTFIRHCRQPSAGALESMRTHSMPKPGLWRCATGRARVLQVSTHMM